MGEGLGIAFLVLALVLTFWGGWNMGEAHADPEPLHLSSICETFMDLAIGHYEAAIANWTHYHEGIAALDNYATNYTAGMDYPAYDYAPNDSVSHYHAGMAAERLYELEDCRDGKEPAGNLEVK